jgi:SpoVK/Ycf46/Vps4 family AAA+-type ATPase
MTLMKMEPHLLRCPDVSTDDFMEALARVKPSVNHEDCEKHVEWTEKFGQDS